jgi:hypothetical protein
MPVAERLKGLKSASELAKACGKSRFLITNMMNDGRIPDYVVVGRARMATLEQVWDAFQREAERDRERRGIKPKSSQPRESDGDRSARVSAAKRALGCKVGK